MVHTDHRMESGYRCLFVGRYWHHLLVAKALTRKPDLLDRHEELDVRGDTCATHVDEVNQLGRHDHARDLRVDVNPPVRRRTWHIDAQGEKGVLAEPERLHQ